MPVSEAQKNAAARWDKENMTTLACRVTKAKAAEFKAACIALETNPHRVFLETINATIEAAKEKNGG